MKAEIQPKEAAEKIFDSFDNIISRNFPLKSTKARIRPYYKAAKECAETFADQIIVIAVGSSDPDMEKFWKEVKAEIINL